MPPNTNPAPIKSLEAGYEQGKRNFYAALNNGAARMESLSTPDRIALRRGEKAFPGLYEQLMNFYPYAIRSDEPEGAGPEASFPVLGLRLASEFLVSIPPLSPVPNLSPLEAAVLSTGYRAPKAAPRYRRPFRSMARPIKGHWGLEELRIREAQALAAGKGVKIAIVDTGLDPTIEEIKKQVADYKDFLTAERPFWGAKRFPFDWGGHGTSIASVIAGVAPDSDLLITRVFDEESMNTVPGNWWTLNLIEAGIAWAAEQGADIINVSAAVWVDVERMRTLVRRCWEKNIILVASMGNLQDSSDSGRVFYPAAYPWTIAVGGADEQDGRFSVWKHSAPGDYIDVVAPAVSVWVEQPSYLDVRTGIRRAFGNSLATALVSGTAALVLSAMDPDRRRALESRPGALFEEVRRILCETASNEKLGLPGRNPKSGWGLVDPLQAVLAVRQEPRR